MCKAQSEVTMYCHTDEEELCGTIDRPAKLDEL